MSIVLGGSWGEMQIGADRCRYIWTAYQRVDIGRMQASCYDDPLDDSLSPEDILRQLFKIEKFLGSQWQPMADQRMQSIVIRLSSILLHVQPVLALHDVDKAVLPSFATSSIEWLNGNDKRLENVSMTRCNPLVELSQLC